MVKIIKLKPLLISLLISVGTGALAGILTMGTSKIYGSLTKPSFAPPSYLFPIVWTILFILMGISAYLVYMTDSPAKSTALKIYLVQLAVNFLWSIIFFSLNAYFFAFIWLVLLWVLIIFMLYYFYMVNPVAAYLQIPYFLWVTFAGVLNFSVAMLN